MGRITNKKLAIWTSGIGILSSLMLGYSLYAAYGYISMIENNGLIHEGFALPSMNLFEKIGVKITILSVILSQNIPFGWGDPCRNHWHPYSQLIAVLILIFSIGVILSICWIWFILKMNLREKFGHEFYLPFYKEKQPPTPALRRKPRPPKSGSAPL